MGMDLSIPGNPANKIGRSLLVIIGLEGKSHDNIDHRSQTGRDALFHRGAHLGPGVTPADALQDGIASGLGPELDAPVCAIAGDERERLLSDELRPDLAWEGAEVDVVRKRGKKRFEAPGTRAPSVRAIGKGVGGDEAGIPIPGCVSHNALHAPVPHDSSENARGLAVSAGERTPPRDLNVSFHPRKGGVGIEDDG